MKVEIENATEVVSGRITKDGRIYGLCKFAGRKAKIVVLEKPMVNITKK